MRFVGEAARSLTGAGFRPAAPACSRGIGSAILGSMLVFAISTSALGQATSEAATPSPVACSQPGQVWWNELLTRDAAKLTAFYSKVIGWTTRAVNPQNTTLPAPEGEDQYVIFMGGPREAAGLMKSDHKDAVHSGSGWFTYIHVRDVDAAVANARKNGGKILRFPTTTAEGDRLAVVRDPLGNAFGLVTPASTGCRAGD